MTSKLSDHEFGLGGGCPQKILHARAGLPRNDREGGFADWMRAESGKVRALARHLFPNAVRVAAPDPAVAAMETTDLIAAGMPVMRGRFETETVRCEIDFLVPDGSTLRIYQVVPRAVDLEQHRRRLEFTGPRGRVRKEWSHQLELLEFRRQVVQQLWPQRRVLPFFVAPVRGRKATMEGLHGFLAQSDDGWTTDNPAVGDEAARLLTTIGVAPECADLQAAVTRKTAALHEWLRAPTAPVIGYACKKCPFKLDDGESGFERCWGPLAEVSPHMFDLAYMYFVQEDGKPVADRLAREGKASVWDLPIDKITGEHADRQLLQLEGMQRGGVIIDPELKVDMAQVTYPLSFLDVETIESATPPHSDVRIGALNIFQLSVHTRSHAGAELVHAEWLNTEREAPNRRFLAALRSMIGDQGTVLVWSPHEKRSFGKMLAELIGDGDDDDNLRWLKRLLTGGRIVDMHQMCYRRYWHPLMVGRTSLKWVLPAVWSEPSPVKLRTPYAQFPADTDPYAVLKAAGQINEGCGAMAAYLEMQASHGEARAKLIRELLEYCGVDTLAMAFCWDAWEYELAQRHVYLSQPANEEARLPSEVGAIGASNETTMVPIAYGEGAGA